MQVSCGSERVRKNIGINNKAEMLNEFAKILPSIRKTLGVSQSELGKRIGVSRQSISSIERGNVALTWNTMLAIMLVVLANCPECFETIIKDEKFSMIADVLKMDSKLEEA